MRKILTEEEFIHAFDTGIEINERTLLEFAYGGVEQQIGENRRWTRSNTTICEIKDRYFKINWEEGLTENQPDACYEQPIEVKKIEYNKTIPEHVVHIIEWVEVRKC